MKKENIIKALELCGEADGRLSCAECPYDGIEYCDGQMCRDAVALLKASEAPKANTLKYTKILVFTKKTSMIDYCTCKVTQRASTTEGFNRMCEYYAREREVQLIAMFRWENGKCFCKIKCPINPLPVKGEFETPSDSVVSRFLNENGWNFKQKFYPRMFE